MTAQDSFTVSPPISMDTEGLLYALTYTILQKGLEHPWILGPIPGGGVRRVLEPITLRNQEMTVVT